MIAAIIANLLVNKENHCNFAKISFCCGETKAINELIRNKVIDRLEIVWIDVILALNLQTIEGSHKPNMAAQSKFAVIFSGESTLFYKKAFFVIC